MNAYQILLPAGWSRPKGYSNGIAAKGRTVFTAGVVGWNEAGEFPAAELPGQVEQVLKNTLEILAEGGAGPEHIVRMTWYVTDVVAYREGLQEIGAAYKALIGRNFPAMAVVEVSALVEPAAKVEIETTAVVPE